MLWPMTPRLPPRIALTALLLVLSPAVSGCGLGESRDEHGRTPLMVAADAGNLEEARRLLRTGANVNARVDSNDLQAFIAFISWMQDVPSRNVGWTPLHFAVQGGHSELAFLLLEHGANVGTVSRNGLTPLLIAVFRGRKDLVQQLLEAGARPAGPRDLLAAIQRRDPEIVRLLLDSGAAVNGRDDKGWTPITAGWGGGSRRGDRPPVAGGRSQPPFAGTRLQLDSLSTRHTHR